MKEKTSNYKKISNWGHFPIVETNFYETSNIDELKNIINNTDSIIARGNGRSYGDNSLNKENIFSTLKLNKFISFDRKNGIFECESGVLLSEILDVIIPEGFFLFVTPGTKFITVGGSIAANVHGKNNHSEGCFGDYVIDFKIITKDGDLKKCSKEKNEQLFWDTIGGMGLTGIIISARFHLKKIQTAYIKQRIIKAENLDDIFNYFEESKNWNYSVAWIDCLQKEKNIGRSILMLGNNAMLTDLPTYLKGRPLKVKKKKTFKIPFFFPSLILNSFTVKAFNFLYYNKHRKKIKDNIVDFETFFYPLDFINDWNKIYGKKGFIQYQFIIPKKNGKIGITEILETIAHSQQGSFLAVLKLYNNNSTKAHNSFPIEGYGIALDFKINKRLKELINTLDSIVEKYNGRIYLAKDALSKTSLIDYIQISEPTNKFTSLQQERIKKEKN